MLLLLLSLLAPPSMTECNYLVIEPMVMKVSWQTESQIKRTRKQKLADEVNRVFSDKTIKYVSHYDESYFYVRRRGDTILEQYKINQLPLEKVLRRSL